jgi:hypothetical protein
MKQKITEKSARRWLRRNSWNIQKLILGVGSEKGSCFHKQMLLCQKIIKAADKEKVAC